MVSRPVITQVASSHPDEPTCRAMSAETMKMPEPIIDPATIIVESSRPSSRTKPEPRSTAPEADSTVAAGFAMQGSSGVTFGVRRGS